MFDEVYNKWREQGRESLTDGELTVLAVDTFFGEVLNGGFYYYFSNQSGGLSAFAPDALRRVCLCPYAPILERFVAMFPQGKPSEDDNARQTQLDTIADRCSGEQFEEVENPFWELYQENKGEFRDKLCAYIVANGRQFVR